MKTLIIILISLLVISCNDESLNPFFNTDPNPFNGYWKIQTTGDLTGAATIYVNSTGSVHNGIPIVFYNLINVNIYIKGTVEPSGKLDAEFYNNYTIEIDSLNIIVSSFDGLLDGTFRDSTASGSYNLTLDNQDSFAGIWEAFRLN